MPESLATLEIQGEQLYQELSRLGDFRPGTISANYRRCGKANCACAQPENRGHGPQYLWTTTQKGKSRAQHLRLGPELEKAEQELENYHQLLRLCDELVGVNGQLCRLRPVSEVSDQSELAALKKKITAEVQQEIEKEISALVSRLLGPRGRGQGLDLEASEMAIRSAMHKAGGVCLGQVVNADGGGYRGATIGCGQGHEASSLTIARSNC